MALVLFVLVVLVGVAVFGSLAWLVGCGVGLLGWSACLVGLLGWLA